MKPLKFNDDCEYNLFTKNIGGEEVKFFLFRIKNIRNKFSDKKIVKLMNLSNNDTPIAEYKYVCNHKHYKFFTPLWIRRELDCNKYGTVIQLLDMKMGMSRKKYQHNMYLLATSYPRDEYIDNVDNEFDKVSINTFIPYSNITITKSFIRNLELEEYKDIPDFEDAYSYMDGIIHYNDG